MDTTSHAIAASRTNDRSTPPCDTRLVGRPRRDSNRNLAPLLRSAHEYRAISGLNAVFVRLDATTDVEVVVAGSYIRLLTGFFCVGGWFVIVPALVIGFLVVIAFYTAASSVLALI